MKIILIVLLLALSSAAYGADISVYTNDVYLLVDEREVEMDTASLDSDATNSIGCSGPEIICSSANVEEVLEALEKAIALLAKTPGNRMEKMDEDIKFIKKVYEKLTH